MDATARKPVFSAEGVSKSFGPVKALVANLFLGREQKAGGSGRFSRRLDEAAMEKRVRHLIKRLQEQGTGS